MTEIIAGVSIPDSASTATYSASDPLRVQSVIPKTRWPTVSPVVP
jgi:hypothetical protein